VSKLTSQGWDGGQLVGYTVEFVHSFDTNAETLLIQVNSSRREAVRESETATQHNRAPVHLFTQHLRVLGDLLVPPSNVSKQLHLLFVLMIRTHRESSRHAQHLARA
jgi:hypothetical protein